MQRPQPTLVPIRTRAPVTETVPAGYNEYVNGHVHTRVEKQVCKAQDEMIKDVTKKVIKIRIRNQGALKTFTDIYGCPPGSAHYALFEEYDQLQEQEEFGSRLTAQQTVGLFVTLSPEPGTVTADELQESFMKMFGLKPKKGINMAVWCIEKATLDGQDNHPHVHCAIQLDKTVVNGERGKVKAMLIRHLKKYKTKSEAYLDIQSVSEKSWNKKIAYIKGEKTDPAKQPMVDRDRAWRRSVGLQDVYAYPDMRIGRD